MQYFFSGVDRALFMAVLATEGAAGMVNAQVATQAAMLRAYRRWPEVPLVLDSGAFQGNTDLEGYAAIVHQIGDRFQWVANLDVIGDQEASHNNWLQLKERDVDALWIYQVEGGWSLNDLENALQTLPRHIGVGGLVPVIKRSPDEALTLIERIGRRLERYWAKAHFFGVGTPTILSAFAGEGWFASADSQSWLAGFKARELLTGDGRRVTCEALGLEFTRDECAAQNIRQIHSWIAGQPIQFSLLADLQA